jgi:hypothetical protein
LTTSDCSFIGSRLLSGVCCIRSPAGGEVRSHWPMAGFSSAGGVTAAGQVISARHRCT